MSPWVLSLFVAGAGALLGLPPALVLGWVLARRSFPGKSVLSALVLAPLVLPPVVTGWALLALVGRRGVLGSVLSSLGVRVAFTPLGAVVAALVVGLPLYVISARTAFSSVDPRLEEVARTCGASGPSTFLRVTLPLAAPGLLAGAVLAFARALGEFGATAVLAGDVPGRTRTLSLAIYALLGTPGGDAEASWLALSSLAMSALALALHEVLLGRHRARLGGRP
jgi:molybdate transport system permease protein